MAERRIKISDISGTEIPDDPKQQVTILVQFGDKRRGVFHLDATLEEGNDLAAKGAKAVETA